MNRDHSAQQVYFFLADDPFGIKFFGQQKKSPNSNGGNQGAPPNQNTGRKRDQITQDGCEGQQNDCDVKLQVGTF